MNSIAKARWLHILGAIATLATMVVVDLNTPGSGVHWGFAAIAAGFLVPLAPWFKTDVAGLLGQKVTSTILMIITGALGALAAHKGGTNTVWVAVATSVLVQLRILLNGGGPGPGAAAVLVPLLCLAASGCSTVSAVAKEATACAGPACEDAIAKSVPAVELMITCDLASAAALTPCAEAALTSYAAALGPDGWKIVGCIVNAIEKDATKPPVERARAKAARALAARKLAGR